MLGPYTIYNEKTVPKQPRKSLIILKLLSTQQKTAVNELYTLQRTTHKV